MGKRESSKAMPGYEVDDRIEAASVTARAGVPLVAELFRSSGSAEVARSSVRVKQRARGLGVPEMIESFLSLWVSGGERCEDFRYLREDAGLAELVGHEFPAPNTARDFLDAFHEADLPLLQSGESASVPSEGDALKRLAKVNRHLALVAERCGLSRYWWP